MNAYILLDQHQGLLLPVDLAKFYHPMEFVFTQQPHVLLAHLVNHYLHLAYVYFQLDQPQNLNPHVVQAKYYHLAEFVVTPHDQHLNLNVVLDKLFPHLEFVYIQQPQDLVALMVKYYLLQVYVCIQVLHLQQLQNHSRLAP